MLMVMENVIVEVEDVPLAALDRSALVAALIDERNRVVFFSVRLRNGYGGSGATKCWGGTRGWCCRQGFPAGAIRRLPVPIFPARDRPWL
ncbi:hypothetical protein ACFS3C_12675 [Azotobacter vinelandii]